MDNRTYAKRCDATQLTAELIAANLVQGTHFSGVSTNGGPRTDGGNDPYTTVVHVLDDTQALAVDQAVLAHVPANPAPVPPPQVPVATPVATVVDLSKVPAPAPAVVKAG